MSWKTTVDRLRPLVWLLPVAVGAVLVIRTVQLSPKKLFWADEILTWYVVAAPLSQAWRAMGDTINAAPPLYFLLGWLWVRLFGLTILSLRLFSVLAAAGASVAMFAVLRRCYGVAAAFLGVALVFWTWPDLLHQSTEARFHVLPLLELALALLLMDRVVRHPKASRTLLGCTFVVHAAIAMTHYFGVLYAVWIVAGGAAVRLWRRRSPWPAIAPPIAGWLTLIPWWPALRRHLDMGKPTTWVPVPDPAALKAFYEGNIPSVVKPLLIALACFAVVTLALRIWRGGRRHLTGRQWLGSGSASLLISGLGFLVVPLAVYVLSRRTGGTSVWLSRYMIPSSLGLAIVAAQLGHLAMQSRQSVAWRPGLSRGAAALHLVVLAFILSGAARPLLEPPTGADAGPPPDPPLAPLPEGSVVVEHIHQFLHWRFFSPRAPQYAFMVDPEVGLAEGGGGPLTEKIMDALGRDLPEQFGNVMPARAYLASHPEFFIVLSGGELGRRLSKDPALEVQRINPWLAHVVRRPASP